MPHMSAWKPISTAPRINRKPLLLREADRSVYVGEWSDHLEDWYGATSQTGWEELHPVEWCEIPE